jgi:hypothetical protein
MGLFSDIKKKAESAGRFLSTTGKGALRKLGEGAKSVRKFGNCYICDFFRSAHTPYMYMYIQRTYMPHKKFPRRPLDRF